MNHTITLFCDIDGTIIKHIGNATEQLLNPLPTLCKNALDAINCWSRKGYKIILTTARKPSMKNITIKQLEELGIIYDDLLMGISNIRILINDCKDRYPTAFAINLERNTGLNFYDFSIHNNIINQTLLENKNEYSKLLSYNNNFIINEIILLKNNSIEEKLKMTNKTFLVLKGKIQVFIYGQSNDDFNSLKSNNQFVDYSIFHSYSNNEIIINLPVHSTLNLHPLSKYKIIAEEDSILIETFNP